MPTHVSTHIKIEGDHDVIEEFLSSMVSKYREFDFSNIIPPSLDNLEGYKNLERWKEGNWGTATNAYDVRIKHSSDSTEIRFNTEWTPPVPVFIELSKINTSLTFDINFADDDELNDTFGAVSIKEGILLAKEIKPKSIEAYKLVFNTLDYSVNHAMCRLMDCESDEELDNEHIAMLEIVFDREGKEDILPEFIVKKLEKMAVDVENFEYAGQLKKCRES